MEELVQQIGRADWDDPREAHASVAASLSMVSEPAALLEGVRHVDPRRAEVDGSAEKTTHFKWFVASDPQGRFELWLNQYKPADQRRRGHAEVPHNHRYWFTSLVLSGGFTSTTYDLRDSGALDPRSHRELRAGATLTVDPAEIHSLHDIQEHTLTFVVQGVPVRSYSEVYERGKVTRYHDLPSAREALNEQLAALQPL
jgi:hypothetical protein